MNDSARTWGLRLLALGIALGFWFRISFEDREVLSERLVEASVSYNRPRGYMILDPVRTVNVRLRGSSRQVRQLNPFMVDVQVELTGRSEGILNIPLLPDNVLRPEGLEVMAIEPNAIRVELEREISQRIPVIPELVGQPLAGSRLEEPEVFPNQVLVTGPESLLAKTESLSTRPINLNGRSATFEETVAVIAPDPLIQIVQPARVSVRVPIQASQSSPPAQSSRPAQPSQSENAEKAQKGGP